VVDPTVTAGKHECLVSVVIPDQIGRSPILTVNFEDLGRHLGLTDHSPLNMKAVTYFGTHHSSSLPAKHRHRHRHRHRTPLSLFPRYRRGNQ